MRGLLILTAVSVNLELILLVTSLRSGVGPEVTALALGTFHVGYLLADRAARFNPLALRVVSTGSLVVTGLTLLDGPMWAALVPVLAASTGVQALRRQLKAVARPSARQKNSAKFLAMAAGGVAAVPALAMAVVLLGGAASWWAAKSARAIRATCAQAPSEVSRAIILGVLGTEFFHHAHYFVYCYTLWRSVDELQLGSVGILFTIGWLAYFVAEAVIGKRHLYSAPVIALGHVLVAACLVTMVETTKLLPLMALWFLTGVGGGTAYMLANGPQASRREQAEDWGHVLGTSAGGVIASLASVQATYWAGAAAATATAGMALLVGKWTMKETETGYAPS